MSRIYDDWENLVGAVLRREKDRQLALCESFSTSSSVDASSRFSFDSAIDDSSLEDFSSRFSFNPFASDVHVPAGVDKQIDQAVSRNWDYAFQPLNDMKSVSRSSGPRVDPSDLSSQHIFFFRNVMAIEYEEIKKATKNFAPDMLLGRGGFGPVYNGWIHEHQLSAVNPGSGLAVAVKKLNLEGFQGHKEWFNEINYLSRLRHSNVVRLIGYSFDKDDRIVVYEFMARGSLYNHLFTSVDTQIDQAVSRNWGYAFHPLIDMKLVSRSSRPRVDPADLSSQYIFFFRNVMAIEYEDIKKATRSFAPHMLLDKGGFGPVYKGWIHEHKLSAVKPGSGLAVAVKKLNLEGYQGHKEWFNEINYLSRLRHSNVVRLIGYSFDKDDRIVVYEFMARGSLYNHLFTRGYISLPWAARTRVAVGAARALAFLHGLEIPVVHRKIKSSNILLDGDFNPKLSDFGIARDGPTSFDTHVTTRVMGTNGYAAPEYIATGHLTTRCDVYGFGVVLLELVSGLRVIDKMRPKGKHNLLKWAIPYFKDKRRLSRIMDSRLEGQYPQREAYTVSKLALQCASSDPELRPEMSDVVVALEKL